MCCIVSINDKDKWLQCIFVHLCLISSTYFFLWCEKDLEAKRKLRYYKEVINPTLKDQKYLYILTSSKKKIYIAKIKTNSHELHSETGRCAVPKTPWVEMISHLCENMNIEDENHFLLECPAYTHIRSQFHNLCCNTDLPSLLTSLQTLQA